ncbi:RNA polymerase sigma factor [Longimicrobium sp.]|uniref:RNA polymerase sigma factor n=1 Tax=Longimicrobium sp. TaxID=2029185 RepID=UPI003B3B9782
MSDRLNAEAVFIEHLRTIERAAAMASRRYSLWGDEAEDFAGWVKMKLMEDDYAVFHKFRGESDWKTFLTTVVARHASAYSRERLGRWRPSAEATRRGPPAPELEMLVRRDGYTLAQAGEKLRTSGATTSSDIDLARLLRELPERAPLRPVQVPAEPVLEAARASSRADARVAAAESDAWRGELIAALHRTMERLTAEDRAILRLYGEGLTAADIARALNIEQKPLYRRIPRLRDALREYLEKDGVSADSVRALLTREDP